MNYVSDRAKITSAYRIGNNAKDHRSLTTAIKRARFMALLPISHDHEIIRSPKNDQKAETSKEEPKAEIPEEEPKAETPEEKNKEKDEK